MKKATCLLVVLVVARAPAESRAPLLENVCNSAGAPGGTAVVNADVSDAGGWATSARLHWSTDNQATWTEAPMSRVGEPGFDSTFAASFGLPGAGTAWYFVSADNGREYGTQAPFNSGNTWPPGDNLLARAALDDTGDTNNGEGPFLDLTGAFVGRSGDRFYCALTNNGGGWPTSGGILKWYAYSFGFSNPEAPSDSWVFGPIYVSAWPVMEHGLYAINRYTGETPERIGDIQRHTDGNRLTMSCLLSDLTGDSRFGPWPNSSGWLWVGATTLAITTSGSSTRDTTFPGRVHLDRTPSFVINQSNAPVLTRARVLPDTGTADTSFWFNVSYSDADSNLPVARRVVVDDTISFDLQPSNHRYWQSVSYSAYRSGFEPGQHRARFVFNDGMAEVTADTGFFVTGLAVTESDEFRMMSDECRMAARPNPFTRTTAISLQLTADSPDRVDIFDATGRLVRRLAASRQPSAAGSFLWDGRDCRGQVLNAGVYFARVMSAGDTIPDSENRTRVMSPFGLRLVKTR
ncbi:hypothetical protein JXB37_05635 [candidate division WOR-3 bacterium]|nr:hypothetical protein [candidate division WOR-3 bacterium]